jgi:carboxynorspermidine decarboxylase
METKAGDPGAFAHFDLNRIASPAFVVDEVAVRRNLAVLKDVRDRGHARVLLALKAFSMWSLADVVGEYLDGVCASGLWEARLAREFYKGELTTYSPAYKAEDLPEILRLSDHVIFNSPDQVTRFADLITKARAEGEVFEIGLRLNPEHSEGEVAKYDPAQPCSRLGFPVSQLRPEHMQGVDGLHIHALCEQDFEPLARIWAAVEPKLAPLLGGVKWLNLGGGHHVTRADYQTDRLVEFLNQIAELHGVQVYLEPGEAEAPYRPAMLHEPEAGVAVRLGGPSCLAGDIIGDYVFAERPTPGTRLAFLDQAHYSMVKTNTFNGVPLPSIALWNSATDELRMVREFDWTEFRDRLS